MYGVTRCKQVTRIQTIASTRALRGREPLQHRCHLVSSAAYRRARACRVLNEQARDPFRNCVQRATHGLTHPEDGRIAITVRGRAWMKTHAAHAKRGRAFEFLGQPGHGTFPLFWLGGRAVQHIRRMHDHVFGADVGRLQCVAKPRHAIWLHAHFVVVVFGHGAEDLQGLHAATTGAACRHVNAARIDAVGAEDQ